MPTSKQKHKIVKLLGRTAKWMCLIFAAYVSVLIVGLIPVNNGFTPPSDGITIYLISNAVHADIIVPRRNEIIDWGAEFLQAKFQHDNSDQTHVAFGWGDRGFFLETPTWSDLSILTASNALLLPSDSCVHVGFTRAENYGADVAAVKIDPAQYGRLVKFIKASFRLDSRGNYCQIDEACYSTCDAFFEANGRYHLFNTCNSWVGRGLRTAEVRVPLMTPMPKSPMLYLPGE